jgi:ribosomal protein L16 Arg81 hydroxylase
MRGRVRPLFDWLIDPVGKKLFFEKYWEKQPLVVSRRQPDYYSSLLSLDEIDRVLTTLDLRHPHVTLKSAARDIDPEEYTVPGDNIDVARAYQLFAEGATVTLAYLDTVIPSLTAFCRDLEAEFSAPFQANVYLTPPGAQGAKIHYDTHDVFVLQVHGSKHWTTYGTPVELPLRDQDFDPEVHEPGEQTLEFELCAGDLAYVPRGCVHQARSSDNVSLHITVGVLVFTWADLLLELVADACLNDAAFRKALPPGFARQDFPKERAREMFDKLWQRLSARRNFDPILDRFGDEFLSSCPPLLRGQMAQLAALDRLTIESVVGVRKHTIARVESDGSMVSVRWFGRKITFPARAAAAVRFALSHDEFPVRALPGDLDDAGKLAIVRRLIREGLLAARLG